MKKSFARLILFSLVTAALVAVPAASRADDVATTNAPAAAAPGAKIAKKKHGQIHGTVAAVDAMAMTLTVNAETFDVTSETIITKDGKPAILADITVGETVKGTYKKDAAGKLAAATISAGEKAPKKIRKKAAAAAATAPAATNAPAIGN